MASQSADVPPPLQDIPTAKEKKYDRQLRLWGAAGQIALEQTHVLLINNGPGVVGVETLKNLVLPGIGQFTIADSAIVTDADLGVNFFLEDASRGKYRAEETCRLLMELNPDVQGHAITEPIETWTFEYSTFLPYTLILIAAPLDPAVLRTIEQYTLTRDVPTFYIHCLGYYTHFSLFLRTLFPVVDTHPDPTATTDLRLLKPWPALLEFAKSQTANMDKMNPEEFAHIPYVCLLLHYLEEWKSTHEGKLPESYKDKVAFRALVRSGSPNEENFDEACAAVLKSLNPPTAPSAVREILNAPQAEAVAANSRPFWVMAHGVQKFYAKHGQLPLPGAVPDMKAKSETYIQLQNIYKLKAREDCAEVIKSIDGILPPAGRIDPAEVENFCKNAAHLALIHGRKFMIVDEPDAVTSFGSRAKYMAQELQNPESLVGLYLAFLAWDEYVVTHPASVSETGGEVVEVPGRSLDAYETDSKKLTGIAHKLVDSIIKEAGGFIEDPDYTRIQDQVGQYCTELARAGGAELHNIASLSGGLIAQEVIKVITKQYVPVDNTVVFDGIRSKSYVLRI